MVHILLDTDVCLDSIAGRDPWGVDANRIFHSSVEGITVIFVSGLSFSNMFYLLRKAHGAKQTVNKLSAMRDLVSVSPIDEKVVDAAFSAGWPDFEDALQYYSALKSGCSIIISRNVSDYGRADELEVLSPSAFVRQFLDEGDSG